MMAASPETPDRLRAAVTSRGGTTQAAAQVLEETGTADLIVRAIVAARDRGRELAGS
jgi:pyrroline-5-carboxylate reductase